MKFINIQFTPAGLEIVQCSNLRNMVYKFVDNRGMIGMGFKIHVRGDLLNNLVHFILTAGI